TLLTHALSLFLFTHPPTPAIYTLSLHDALPISRTSRNSLHPVPSPTDPASFRRLSRCKRSARRANPCSGNHSPSRETVSRSRPRSEEHTSELQSPYDLVCRLLLEKKKKKKQNVP